MSRLLRSASRLTHDASHAAAHANRAVQTFLADLLTGPVLTYTSVDLAGISTIHRGEL